MSSSQFKSKRNYSLSSIPRLDFEDQSIRRMIDSQAQPVDGSYLTTGNPSDNQNEDSNGNGRQSLKTFSEPRPQDQFISRGRPPLVRKHRSLPSLKDGSLQQPLTRSKMKIPQLTGSQLIHHNYFYDEMMNPQHTMSVFSSDSSSQYSQSSSQYSQSDPTSSTKDRNSREMSWRASNVETFDLPDHTIAEASADSSIEITAPIPVRHPNHVLPLRLAKQYSPDVINPSKGPDMQAQRFTPARRPPEIQYAHTTKSTPRPQNLKITTNPKASIFSRGEIKRRASKQASGIMSAARENFSMGVDVVHKSPVSKSGVVYTPSDYGSASSSGGFKSSVKSASPVTPDSHPHMPVPIPPQPPTIQEEGEEGEEGRKQRQRARFVLGPPTSNHHKKPGTSVRFPQTPYPDQTTFPKHDNDDHNKNGDRTPIQEEDDEESQGTYSQMTPTQTSYLYHSTISPQNKQLPPLPPPPPPPPPRPPLPSTSAINETTSPTKSNKSNKSTKLTRMFSFTTHDPSRTQDPINGQTTTSSKRKIKSGIVTNKKRHSYDGPGTPSPWKTFETITSPVKEGWSTLRDRLSPREVERLKYEKKREERKREIGERGGIWRPGKGVEPQDPNTGRVPVWI